MVSYTLYTVNGSLKQVGIEGEGGGKVGRLIQNPISTVGDGGRELKYITIHQLLYRTLPC